MPLGLFDQIRAGVNSVKAKARQMGRAERSELVLEFFSTPALIVTALFVAMIGSIMFPALNPRENSFLSFRANRLASFSESPQNHSLRTDPEIAFDRLLQGLLPFPNGSFQIARREESQKTPFLAALTQMDADALPVCQLFEDLQEIHSRMAEAERKIAAAAQDELHLSQRLNRLHCEQVDLETRLSADTLSELDLDAESPNFPSKQHLTSSAPISRHRKGAELLVFQ